MVFGLWILSFFAALWGVWALSALHVPPWWWLAPVAVSGVILALRHRTLVAFAARFPRSPDEQKRIGRLVGTWSAAEGLAIFVTANVLQHLGAGRLLPPAMAVIVGLHFMPLARGMRMRLYYFAGSALILAGLGSVLLPDPYPAPIACSLAALVLWTTALWRVPAPTGATAAA
jgi:hypothetical protein